MATFEVTGPDGTKYEVTGPPGATEQEALAQVQAHVAADVSNRIKPDFLGATAYNMPIVGPLLQKGEAAIGAGIQPIFGVGAPTFGERYAKNLGDIQQAYGQYAQQNPGKNLGAALLGGTMLAVPAAQALPAAFGVGTGGLVGNTARSVATNAAIGGTDAALRGESPAQGAAIGGAFGALGPVTGRVIGAVANRVSAPVTPAATVAANKVAAPLMAEGLTTPEAVTARLNTISPEASLVDANPELSRMGGAIAASPGPGQQTIRSALEGRAAGAGDRIISDLDASMGKPVDLDAMANSIYQNAKSAAGPLYKEAAQVSVPMTPELQGVLDTPFGRQALAKARQLGLSDTSAPASPMLSATAKPAAVDPALQSIIDRGGPNAEALQAALGVQTNADVRGLHLVRQAFDDMINRAQRAGDNNRARILTTSRGTIDQSLKSVPQMAQADAIYSDMSGIKEAMKNGVNIFRNNMTPENVSAQLAGMSEAERQGYLQGGRVAVRNVMGTARNNASAAQALFNKEFNQEKLRMLVGDDAASTILKRIGAEQQFAKTANTVMGNSETAARALTKADLADAHGLPTYRDTMIFSGPHGVARRVIAGAIEKTLEAASSGRQKAIEGEIAKLLVASGPDRSEAINAVMSAALKKDPSGGLNRLIALAVARAGRPSPDDNHIPQQTAQPQLYR